MKKRIVAIGAALALVTSAPVAAKTWTFETDQATFNIDDPTDYWQSVTMSTELVDGVGSYFYWVSDAVLFQFRFAGPESGEPGPAYVTASPKGEWRSVAGYSYGDDPIVRAIYFGLPSNFHYPVKDGGVSPIPEPSTYGMVGIALAGIGLSILRRRREKT